MASSWDRVGQVASVMQVTGVDAFGLVSMIVQAAHTARRNRDLCQQLAQHVLIVADLLRKLDIPALRQHLETGGRWSSWMPPFSVRTSSSGPAPSNKRTQASSTRCLRARRWPPSFGWRRRRSTATST
jgi:hypothetical protein